MKKKIQYWKTKLNDFWPSEGKIAKKRQKPQHPKIKKCREQSRKLKDSKLLLAVANCLRGFERKMGEKPMARFETKPEIVGNLSVQPWEE